MDWFKLHHDARVDKKLSALSDAQHRIWFNLLCFASEQKERGHIPEKEEILLAVEVANGNQTALQETLDLLVTFQIIETKDGIKFLHWAERQYINPSDAPAATRIRKQSSRMSRACHEMSRVSRAQIQIQIADPDTDTEKKKKKDPPLPPQRGSAAPKRVLTTYPEAFEVLWAAYPRPTGKKEAFATWTAWVEAGVPPEELLAGVQGYANHCRKERTEERFIKHPATLLGPGEHWKEYLPPPPGKKKETIDSRFDTIAEQEAWIRSMV